MTPGGDRPMQGPMLVLEFHLGESRYAVPVERVIEVLPRLWLTPLPGAGDVVEGAFNHRGTVLVVVDLRARFGAPSRQASIDDHLVVVRGARRALALAVDRVSGLREVSPSDVQPPPVALRHVRGVATVDDGIVLLQDLDAALSLDEEQAVDRALQRLAP